MTWARRSSAWATTRSARAASTSTRARSRSAVAWSRAEFASETMASAWSRAAAASSNWRYVSSRTCTSRTRLVDQRLEPLVLRLPAGVAGLGPLDAGLGRDDPCLGRLEPWLRRPAAALSATRIWTSASSPPPSSGRAARPVGDPHVEQDVACLDAVADVVIGTSRRSRRSGNRSASPRTPGSSPAGRPSSGCRAARAA